MEEGWAGESRRKRVGPTNKQARGNTPATLPTLWKSKELLSEKEVKKVIVSPER